MNYKDIKDFNQRCEDHPDHQTGMVSDQMMKDRLFEEIDELRAFIEAKLKAKRKWVGMTRKERSEMWWSMDMSGMPEHDYGKAIEAKLRERNT